MTHGQHNCLAPDADKATPLARAGNPHPNERLAMSSEDVWYMQHMPAERPLALRRGKHSCPRIRLRKIFFDVLFQ